MYEFKYTSHGLKYLMKLCTSFLWRRNWIELGIFYNAMLQQCKINRWHTKPAWCAWLSLTLHTHIAAHARINQWKQINIFVRAMKFYALRENCFKMAKNVLFQKLFWKPSFMKKSVLSTWWMITCRAWNLGWSVLFPVHWPVFLSCMKQNVTGASHLLRMAQRRVSLICA